MLEGLESKFFDLLVGLISEAIDANGSVVRRPISMKKVSDLTGYTRTEAKQLLNSEALGFEERGASRFFLDKDFDYSPKGIKKLKEWYADSVLISNWISLTPVIEGDASVTRTITGKESDILHLVRKLENEGMSHEEMKQRLVSPNRHSQSNYDLVCKVIQAVGMVSLQELKRLTHIPTPELISMTLSSNSKLKITNYVMTANT